MVSPDRQSQKNPEQQKQAFQKLFAGLPEDPSQRLDALSEVNHAFRRALADQLQPVVRTLLQESPPADAEGKRALVHRLNHVLHDANLAIANPDSDGQAASVVVHENRLRLQPRHAIAGARNSGRNTKALPPLDLIDYVRQEPISKWRGRLNQEKSENSRPR